MSKILTYTFFIVLVSLCCVVNGTSFSPAEFPRGFDTSKTICFSERTFIIAKNNLGFGVKLELEDDLLRLEHVSDGSVVFVFRNGGPVCDLTLQKPIMKVLQGDVVIVYSPKLATPEGIAEVQGNLQGCLKNTDLGSCIGEQYKNGGGMIFGTTIITLDMEKVIQLQHYISLHHYHSRRNRSSQQIGFVIDSSIQSMVTFSRQVRNLTPTATATITLGNLVNLAVQDGACIFVIRQGLSIPTGLGCSMKLVAKSQLETQSTLRLKRGDEILLITPKSMSIESRPWDTAIKLFWGHPQSSLEKKAQKFFFMNPELDGSIVLVQ